VRFRSVLGLLLSLAILLVPLPTSAYRGHGGYGSILPKFVDVADDDWSLPYVLEMCAKGLMKGVGNGKFEPNAPLTRAQAVTVAVRLMGLEDEAPELSEITPEMLPFTDRSQIPDWAKPYVAVAVEQEILPVAEDGLLRPNEKASRLWVSVLLVRALGYDAEAQAKMTAELPFKDAALIPPSLVGYVAAAVDHELVTGFPDGTCRPNDPLTRAQAAALLSRTDRQLDEIGRVRPGILTGTLKRVDTAEDTLTLTLRTGEEQTVKIAPGALIFLDLKPAEPEDLPEGARLTVVLGPDKQAIFITARDPEPEVKAKQVTGTIADLFLPEETDGSLGLIVIETNKNEQKSFPLAPEITVTLDGRRADLSDLQEGDKVAVKVVAGVAVAIEVTERSGGDEAKPEEPAARKDEIKGTVTEIRPYSSFSVGKLVIQTDSGTREVKVAPGVLIYQGGRRIRLADLEEGDLVTVRVIRGFAIRITVDDQAEDDDVDEDKKKDRDKRKDHDKYEVITGIVRSISRKRIQIRDASGRDLAFELNDDIRIRKGQTAIAISHLKEGSSVILKVKSGKVVEIELKT